MAASRTNLRVHFIHRHVQDMIVILKEGKIPHPCCNRCNILVPWGALNRSYPTMALYRRGKDWKRQDLDEKEVRLGEDMVFNAYWKPLKMVSYLKYLERVISASDENWPTVEANIWKAQKKWAWLSLILGWEGADTKTSGMFYKAVVQAVPLFILETLVMTLRIGRTLRSFHHWVSRRLTVKQPCRDGESNCRYTPMYVMMVKAFLKKVEIYIP